MEAYGREKNFKLRFRYTTYDFGGRQRGGAMLAKRYRPDQHSQLAPGCNSGELLGEPGNC